jgi:hypothetical protein
MSFLVCDSLFLLFVLELHFNSVSSYKLLKKRDKCKAARASPGGSQTLPGNPSEGKKTHRESDKGDQHHTRTIAVYMQQGDEEPARENGQDQDPRRQEQEHPPSSSAGEPGLAG